jgi:hypothetical protein
LKRESRKTRVEKVSRESKNLCPQRAEIKENERKTIRFEDIEPLDKIYSKFFNTRMEMLGKEW